MYLFIYLFTFSQTTRFSNVDHAKPNMSSLGTNHGGTPRCRYLIDQFSTSSPLYPSKHHPMEFAQSSLQICI